MEAGPGVGPLNYHNQVSFAFTFSIASSSSESDARLVQTILIL